MKIHEPGTLELVFTPTNGPAVRREVFKFKGKGGCGLAMYNTIESMTNFAHNSF
jgi:isocitrate dehydrogenase